MSSGSYLCPEELSRGQACVSHHQLYDKGPSIIAAAFVEFRPVALQCVGTAGVIYATDRVTM